MSTWLVSLLQKVSLSAASVALAFVSGRTWKGFIKPWIWDFWYSGPHLAPCYRGEFTVNGKEASDLIELKQKASKVWGTMTYPSGGHGRYKFEGLISENVL